MDSDLLYCRSEAHSASALSWCCWMASVRTQLQCHFMNLAGVWLFLALLSPKAVFGNYLTKSVGPAVLVRWGWRGGSAATVAGSRSLLSDGLYWCPWNKMAAITQPSVSMGVCWVEERRGCCKVFRQREMSLVVFILDPVCVTYH